MRPDRSALETRVASVLDDAATAAPVGRSVPAFDPTRHARPVRRRRVRRVAALSVVGGLVVTGSAAAAVIHFTTAPVTNLNEAICYPVDHRSPNVDTATIAAAAPPGIEAKVTHALQQCSLVWSEGFFVTGSPKTHHVPPGPLTNNHSVPPLVVCVLPSGAAGVFPGNPATCAQLGLPNAEASHKQT